MNTIDVDDAPSPSLWRDLCDGRAGFGVRLLVCIAAGIFLAGGALVMSYLVAAFAPGLNRTFYNYMGAGRGMVPVPRTGVYPKEGLIAFMMMVAATAWTGSIVWLFFRGARQRPLVRPIMITLAIVVVTIAAGILVDSWLRGEQELVIIGLSLVAAAAVLIVWLQALRQLATGRPLRNREDRLLDVRCPECGYRMVGLHESRCPECGKVYTLDELLTRQNFAKVDAAKAPVTQPPPPPIPPREAMPHPGYGAGQPA